MKNVILKYSIVKENLLIVIRRKVADADLEELYKYDAIFLLYIIFSNVSIKQIEDTS